MQKINKYSIGVKCSEKSDTGRIPPTYNKKVGKNSRKLCFIPVITWKNRFIQRETVKVLVDLQAFSPPKAAERKRPAETGNNRADKKRVKNTQFQPRLTVSLQGLAQSRKKIPIFSTQNLS